MNPEKRALLWALWYIKANGPIHPESSVAKNLNKFASLRNKWTNPINLELLNPCIKYLETELNQ